MGGQDLLGVSAVGSTALPTAAPAAGPGGHDTLIRLGADETILIGDYNIAN